MENYIVLVVKEKLIKLYSVFLKKKEIKNNRDWCFFNLYILINNNNKL